MEEKDFKDRLPFRRKDPENSNFGLCLAIGALAGIALGIFVDSIDLGTGIGIAVMVGAAIAGFTELHRK